MAVIGAIEIAARNRVCLELDKAFRTDNWLFNPPKPFKWKERERKNIKEAKKSAQRAEYSKLDSQAKKKLDILAFPNGVPENLSHFKIVGKRQEQLVVKNGQIIAQLTLYFWKRLFSEHYERVLWKRSLKHVFPNKKLARSEIAAHMEVLYQARNRIAHHEPIYGIRLERILSSITFMVENFAVRVPTDNSALARFIEPHKNQLDTQVAEFNEVWKKLTITGE